MEIRHDFYTTFFSFTVSSCRKQDTDFSSYRHLGVSYTDADNWTSSLLPQMLTLGPHSFHKQHRKITNKEWFGERIKYKDKTGMLGMHRVQYTEPFLSLFLVASCFSLLYPNPFP